MGRLRIVPLRTSVTQLWALACSQHPKREVGDEKDTKDGRALFQSESETPVRPGSVLPSSVSGSAANPDVVVVTSPQQVSPLLLALLGAALLLLVAPPLASKLAPSYEKPKFPVLAAKLVLHRRFSSLCWGTQCASPEKSKTSMVRESTVRNERTCAPRIIIAV